MATHQPNSNKQTPRSKILPPSSQRPIYVPSNGMLAILFIACLVAIFCRP